jgi:hypothetical protein
MQNSIEDHDLLSLIEDLPMSAKITAQMRTIYVTAQSAAAPTAGAAESADSSYNLLSSQLAKLD